MQDTVDSFWRMVWEHDVASIVMYGKRRRYSGSFLTHFSRIFSAPNHAFSQLHTTARRRGMNVMLGTHAHRRLMLAIRSCVP